MVNGIRRFSRGLDRPLTLKPKKKRKVTKLKSKGRGVIVLDKVDKQLFGLEVGI
jgi:hypothetical protein